MQELNCIGPVNNCGGGGQGATGPAGPAGPAGGPAGPTGPTGPTGPVGPAVTSIPASAVTYSANPAEALAGATNAAAALDKAAQLLKLLNNAGFASAANGTVPVYDAAQGKFIPTDAANLLTPAQFKALQDLAFAGSAPGAVLAIDPVTGKVAAIPVLQALKNGAPGINQGDTFVWDAATSKWIVGPVTIAPATYKALVQGLPAGVLASVPGLDAAGNPVKQSPAAMVGAVLAAAPAATAANPATKVNGLDAAGNPVTLPVAPLSVTTSGASLAPATITYATPTAGNTLLASVKAPAAGRYMLNLKAGYVVKPTGNEPKGDSKFVGKILVATTGPKGIVAQTEDRSILPAVQNVTAGTDTYGNILMTTSVGPFDYADQEQVDLLLLVEGSLTTTGVTSTEYYTPTLTLTRIPDKGIFG